MKNIKILIVEDEILTATDLRESLISIGYKVVGIADCASKALHLTQKHEPDIILLDIKIKGPKNGIEAAKMIKEYWTGPIVFITAHTEKETIENAKSVNPNAYLIKPFRLKDVLANIDMAIHNFYYNNEAHKIRPLTDFIFLPVSGHYEKVNKKDILLIEASGSYIKIKTTDKNYMLSANLKTFEKQLDDPFFIRVSRKYTVNLEHINKLETTAVYLKAITEPITIGEVYRKNIFDAVQVIRTK